MAHVEQTWSTGQAPHGNALSYWKDVVCENLLDMRIDSANEVDFFGHMTKYAFGPFKANIIDVSEQRVSRQRASSHGAHEGLFHLIHLRKGVQHVEQYGREFTVNAGECVLVDCLAGFDFRFPHGVEALVLEIRRDWLIGWLPAPEEAAARVIRGDGWGGTLSSALANVTPDNLSGLAMPPAVIAEQIAVMLALAGSQIGPSPSSHKRALHRRVLDTLRERCHEPDLTPAVVASTLGLSRRYIHVLFASAGSTFTQQLYDFRLQRAQRLLTDKRFAGVGIAEIAWNCGFSEPSHFTRRFRQRFGVAPTAYRHGISS